MTNYQTQRHKHVVAQEAKAHKLVDTEHVCIHICCPRTPHSPHTAPETPVSGNAYECSAAPTKRAYDDHMIADRPTMEMVERAHCEGALNRQQNVACILSLPVGDSRPPSRWPFQKVT